MRPARQTRYAIAHDLDSWKTDLSARSLYDRLADQTVPPWDLVAAEAEAAYRHNQADGALTLWHVRLVWTAHLP